MERMRPHPLDRFPRYKLVGQNAKFGGVYEYKVPNKLLTGLMTQGETVGPTRVRVFGDPDPSSPNASDHWVVCWIKAIGTEEMKEALACMVIMGRTKYVLVRSFGS